MASNNCFACGSKLSFRNNREATCTNPSCQGGGRYVRCGFCKEMSFAVRYAEAMMCINPRCKMHNIRRKVCPTCNKASLILLGDKEVCINRNCPSNATVIDTCFFCGNKSFLRRNDLMFCTKGDCPFLLDEARMCAFCQQRSYLVRNASCQNRPCEMFDVRVENCPQCGQRTAVVDPATENLSCKSEQCKQLAAVDAAEMTLDFIDLSQLKDQEQGGPGQPPSDDEATQIHPSAAPQAAPAGSDGGTVVYRRPGAAPDIPAPSPPPPAPEPEPAPPPPIPEPVSPPGQDNAFIEPDNAEFKPEDEEEVLVFEGVETAPKPPAPPTPVAREAEPEAAPSPPAPEPEPEPAPPPLPAPTVSNPNPPPLPPTHAPRDDEGDEEEEEDDDVVVVRKKRKGTGKFGPPSKPAAPSPPPPSPAPKPEAAPTPAPTPAPPPAKPAPVTSTKPRPMAPSAFAASPVMRVFRFLKENVLQDTQGRSYPLYLVIGLGGSGKTIYLTMLGDILLRREKAYYFPYKGIGIEPVLVERVLKSDPERFRAEYGSDLAEDLRKVKDLVHEFSSEIFQKYIAKNLWALHTPLEEDSTYFLITEITRNEKTIAKIATVETSGEAFESIIRGMKAGRLDSRGSNAIENVLNEMLDIAEGFVILIDPSRENNDEIYRNLFLALRQGIEPRAMNRFYREVKEVLAGQDKASQGGVMALVGQYMKEQSDQAKLQEGIQGRGKELKARLEEAGRKFADPQVDFKTLIAEEEDFLAFFNEQFQACFPEEYERGQTYLQKNEGDFDLFRKYFIQSFKLALANLPQLAEYVYVQEQMKSEADAVAARQSFEQKKSAARKVMEKYGIDINIDIDEALPDDQHVVRFKNLKFMAVAVTKSDMYPIVFPPEKYPQKKLTVCSSYLRELENFLKFLGGKVRYYNTSATGYSVLQGTQYVPGHENTLTPINVIEPIFDMLKL